MPRFRDMDEPESSSWLFTLLSIVVGVVLVGVGLPWWASVVIGVAIGLALGAAQRRWPTV